VDVSHLGSLAQCVSRLPPVATVTNDRLECHPFKVLHEGYQGLGDLERGGDRADEGRVGTPAVRDSRVATFL